MNIVEEREIEDVYFCSFDGEWTRNRSTCVNRLSSQCHAHSKAERGKEGYLNTLQKASAWDSKPTSIIQLPLRFSCLNIDRAFKLLITTLGSNCSEMYRQVMWGCSSIVYIQNLFIDEICQILMKKVLYWSAAGNVVLFGEIWYFFLLFLSLNWWVVYLIIPGPSIMEHSIDCITGTEYQINIPTIPWQRPKNCHHRSGNISWLNTSISINCDSYNFIQINEHCLCQRVKNGI